VVLPSESEGWPKVIAEGMFWGCLPIATRVSCLPNMLDNGNRGLLLDMNFDKDVHQILTLLENLEAYADKVQKSILWSRKYTLDLFENEIKALIHS
jgi:glycosyltransferase involved in cell wall biosynthesis